MMKDSLVLSGVSPLCTADEILKKLACDGQIGQIDMSFPEIPERGRWYGKAYLKAISEGDLSQVSVQNFSLLGVPVTVNRANFQGCSHEGASESFTSFCSSVNNSLYKKQSDNMLLVKDLKRNKSKALDIKKYFSRHGRVQSVSLHFDLNCKKGFAIVELDSVENKRAAIARNKNPVLCKGRVSIEKLPGDSFGSRLSSTSSWNKSEEPSGGGGTSAGKLSTNRANVLERDIKIASGKPVEISIDFGAHRVENITFKSSGELGGYFVEIVA